MQGLELYIAQPTINQSGGAVVVTTASTVYSPGAPATGASVTITNGYAIYIDNTPNIYMGAAAGTISLIANTQNSLKFTTSTIAGQAYLALDTRTTVSAIQAVSITPSAPTIASAAGSVYNVLYVTPPLITFSGTNTVTAMQGIGLSIGQVLYAGTAATVTTASTLYIYGGPTPGGSVTVTNSYAIYIANNSNIFLGGAASILVLKSATAATWKWTLDTLAGTAIFTANTTTTTDNSTDFTFAPQTQTIAGAAGTYHRGVGINAHTLTTSTTTTITAMQGLELYIAQPTINQSGGAVVVTTASTLYVAGAPATGASVTVTNGYAIYIDNTPNIYMGAAAGVIVLKSATTAALLFTTDTLGGTQILSINTTTTSNGGVDFAFHTQNQTVASNAGANHRVMVTDSYTYTTSTTTTITAMQGMELYLGQVTIAQSGGAVVVTTASAFYIGGAAVIGGSVTVTNNYALYIDNTPNIFMGAAACDITIIANTQNALKFTTSTVAGQAYLALDTRITVTGIQVLAITPSAPTIASAAGDTYSCLYITVPTITLTNTTLVTALDGMGIYLTGNTITDSSVETVTEASTLYVGTPVIGGSITITNIYPINTQCGAFLLASTGTWTNKPSWSALKADIQPFELARTENIWNWLRDEYKPVTYFYKDQNMQGHRSIGFLLDDFQKTEAGRDVFKLITANDDGGILTKDTEGLLLMLVQESAKRIASLEKRLAERTN